MNNLMKRALFGSLFVGILVFSILFSKITFIVLFLIIMNLSLFEFNRLIKLKSLFPYILGNLLFVFANALNVKDIPSQLLSEYAGVALFLGFFATFISIIFSKKEEAVSELFDYYEFIFI